MIVSECVHAYSSSYTSVACDSTYHTLGMDTEVVDSGGYHDNTTNNSRITFPSGGVFLVFGAPQISDPGFGVFSRVTKNGSPVGSYEYATDGFAAGPTQLTGTTPFWLDNFSSGDYMESQIWNNRDAAGGGTNFRNARTQMAAVEVSDWSCHVADSSSSSASPQTFSTTIYDPHGMVTSSTVFTAQRAGYYLIVTIFHHFASSYIHKNGGGRLRGSLGSEAGAADYVVDYFEVGDYVEMEATGEMLHRQLAMIYLGDAQASLAYTYNSVDIHNSDAGFTAGVLRTDSEWIDTGHGHPQHGFSYNISPAYCISCGSFNMVDGYHFALAKISTDGGTFLQNDGCYTVLNGTQLGNVFSTNRHQRGSVATTLAFSCFQATYGDTFSGNWLASGTYTESAYTPWTNVFVTDAAEGGPQIYRRL